MRRYVYLLITFTSILFVNYLNQSVAAQDVETTGEVLPPVTSTWVTTIEAGIAATSTPTFTLTFTATTVSPELTEVVLPSSTPTPVFTPTALTPTVEITEAVEMTVKPVTTEVSQTPDEIIPVMSPIPVSVSPVPTQLPTVQPTLAVSSTPEASITPGSLISITPTATLGGYAVNFVQIEVSYQNRPVNKGIHVIISDTSDTLLSAGRSDSSGVVNLSVPIDIPYIVEADAPLYRRLHLDLAAGAPIPVIVLAGGDLDDDGCIGVSDLNILHGALEQPSDVESADITGDGFVDLADMAVLTGNYEGPCESAQPTLQPTVTETSTDIFTPTPEPTVLVTPVVPVSTLTPTGSEGETTPEVTPEILPPTLASTATPLPTIPEITEEPIVSTHLPTLTITPTPTFTWTATPTMSATPLDIVPTEQTDEAVSDS